MSVAVGGALGTGSPGAHLQFSLAQPDRDPVHVFQDYCANKAPELGTTEKFYFISMFHTKAEIIIHGSYVACLN